MKQINHYNTTITISRPNPIPIIWCIFFVFLICSILEICIFSNWITAILPFPSPSISSSYPEIGVKFQRLRDAKSINCMFFGSSMVDADLAPKLFDSTLIQSNGLPLNCFNMGLSGSTVETSGVVSTTLANWRPLKFIVFGISPLEMNKETTKTRPIAQMPVFSYYNGRPSFEGWLFTKFNLPWYSVALPHLLNREFLAEESSWDQLLDDRGLRRTSEIGTIEKGNQKITLAGFKINEADMDIFQSSMTRLKDQGIQIVVVEMPVHPEYFPYLVEGGITEYQKEFILPIENYLKTKNIPFLRTQEIIGNLVNESDWYNRNHLNYEGAEKFSTFIAKKISDEGILR